MIKLTAHCAYDSGILQIEISQQLEPYIQKFIEGLNGAPAVIEAHKWHRARSTGEKSQNHHINGHIAQIAEVTGNDFDMVKYVAKYQAISAGYPFYQKGTLIIPWSETRIDSRQAAILIDTIHRIAAEEGINLIEEDI